MVAGRIHRAWRARTIRAPTLAWKNFSGVAGANYSRPYPGMEELLRHGGRKLFAPLPQHMI